MLLARAGARRDSALSKANGISQIVWSRLRRARGALTGKYKPGAAAPEGFSAQQSGGGMGQMMGNLLGRRRVPRGRVPAPSCRSPSASGSRLGAGWRLRVGLLREENGRFGNRRARARPEQVARTTPGASGIELDGATARRDRRDNSGERMPRPRVSAHQGEAVERWPCPCRRSSRQHWRAWPRCGRATRSSVDRGSGRRARPLGTLLYGRSLQLAELPAYDNPRSPAGRGSARDVFLDGARLRRGRRPLELERGVWPVSGTGGLARDRAAGDPGTLRPELPERYDAASTS